MALDATPAGSASDSYLTVADADALSAADLGRFAVEWASATVDVKERALRRATRDLDRATGYQPDRYAVDQSLAFPRIEDVDDAGTPIIPSDLRLATYEQAKYLLRTADQIDDAAARRARGMVNFTEPNVSGQISDDPGFGRLAPAAAEYLGSFTQRSTVGWIVTT